MSQKLSVVIGFPIAARWPYGNHPEQTCTTPVNEAPITPIRGHVRSNFKARARHPPSRKQHKATFALTRPNAASGFTSSDRHRADDPAAPRPGFHNENSAQPESG